MVCCTLYAARMLHIACCMLNQGSSVFGIFSKSPPGHKDISMFDHPDTGAMKYVVIVAVLALVGTVTSTMVWYFMRNMDDVGPQKGVESTSLLSK